MAHQARKLCAIVVDTMGREIMTRRPFRLENGWPVHDNPIDIKSGQRLTLTTRPEAEASTELLPITYDRFPDMVEPGDTIYIGRCATL